MHQEPQDPLDASPGDLAVLVRHELVVLLLLAGLAVFGFVGTRAAARAVEARVEADAARWFERGRARLAAGDAAGAVRALRQATFREQDTWPYASELSSALAASGQPEVARQLLLRWRDREPGNPDISLRLARLEADTGRVIEATRAYERALYGEWPAEQVATRDAVRRELIRFLLRHGDRRAALPQVLALDAGLPDTEAAYLDLGTLLLEAGDPARALRQFQRALRVAPGSRPALAGAGRSAFELGDDPAALRYLAQAGPQADAELLARARASVESDPLARGLSLTSRRDRLIAALDHAAARRAACLAPGAADGSLAAFRASLTRGRLRREPEIVEDGLALVDATLTALPASCPPDDRDEPYLRVLARRRGQAP